MLEKENNEKKKEKEEGKNKTKRKKLIGKRKKGRWKERKKKKRACILPGYSNIGTVKQVAIFSRRRPIRKEQANKVN